MKLPPQMIGEEWEIVGPTGPVDPIVYTQTFSPAFPEVVTPNENTVFKATTNALVKQNEEMSAIGSTAPQIPIQQPNLMQTALVGVGIFLIFKLIFKKG